MKRTFIILTALLGITALAMFAFDAMQGKAEREILVVENYVPPERAAAPAPHSDHDLTPMP